MGKIKVKYEPNTYKGIFAFANLARTKLKVIKWIRY